MYICFDVAKQTKNKTKKKTAHVVVIYQ